VDARTLHVTLEADDVLVLAAAVGKRPDFRNVPSIRCARGRWWYNFAAI